MAWTQTDLDNLKAVLATGARSITIDGELTVFRTKAEIDELLAEMQADIAASQPGARVVPLRPFVRTWHIDRGLSGRPRGFLFPGRYW